MAFGLISTTLTGVHDSLRNRRRIYYQYPTGAAQLMGLLSLLPEQSTDKSEFGWWEDRFPTQVGFTADSGTATSSPFLNEDNTVLTDSGSGVTLTVGVVYRLTMVDTGDFKRTHVIEFRNIALHDGTTLTSPIGVVTEVTSSTVLKFRLDATATTVSNRTADTPNNATTATVGYAGSNAQTGIAVAIIGTANQEGARSTNGLIRFPVNPTNYTQIFRAAFSLARTALKAGMEFDKTGPYAMTAKQNGLRHMIEMEKALFFGNKYETTVVDPTSGDITPERHMGGIRYFLQQWEKANSIYRNGPAGTCPAATSNSDMNKRIIDLSTEGSTLTKSSLNTYLERLFLQSNDKGFEKICLCGSHFLGVINQLLERQVVRMTEVEEKTENFRIVFTTIETLYGTVHFKVHPLFNQDPGLRNNGMFLDLGNLKYRPLNDGDTMFFKGRQENDRDARKDEWVTEMSMELDFPETCMYMMNAATAS